MYQQQTTLDLLVQQAILDLISVLRRPRWWMIRPIATMIKDTPSPKRALTARMPRENPKKFPTAMVAKRRGTHIRTLAAMIPKGMIHPRQRRHRMQRIIRSAAATVFLSRNTETCSRAFTGDIIPRNSIWSASSLPGIKARKTSCSTRSAINMVYPTPLSRSRRTRSRLSSEAAAGKTLKLANRTGLAIDGGMQVTGAARGMGGMAGKIGRHGKAVVNDGPGTNEPHSAQLAACFGPCSMSGLRGPCIRGLVSNSNWKTITLDDATPNEAGNYCHTFPF